MTRRLTHREKCWSCARAENQDVFAVSSVENEWNPVAICKAAGVPPSWTSPHTRKQAANVPAIGHYYAYVSAARPHRAGLDAPQRARCTLRLRDGHWRDERRRPRHPTG